MRAITQRRHFTILRDDHIGDTLSAIFLDVSSERADWVIGLIREYLGRRVRILKIELTTERAELEVEVQAFIEESSRLAAAAIDLYRKGAPRNAIELFREALRLDPLNHTAFLQLGLLFSEGERYDEALTMLKRARESGPESVEILCALGQAALKQERTASAIVYLERAYELAPSHFGVRRALTDLGRKPKPLPRGQSVPAARPSPSAADRRRR